MGVIFYIIYGFFIFFSVLIVLLEMLCCDVNKIVICGEVYYGIFFIIELICVVVFMLELLVWFYVCFEKKKFMFDVLNIIDVFVIFLYYIILIVMSFGVDLSYI